MVNLAGIDLNLLVAFDALVAERSVSQAAQRVGLSQPAMSNALARLRRLLDDPVMLRSRHGMEPTPRALELAPTVHQALAVHGAPGNRRSDRRRRAYIQRWCGDDVTWDPRPNIQPMLRDPGLKPGDPMQCELFPQAWPPAG